MNRLEHRAYHKGYIAFGNDQSYAACPHTPGTPEAECWNQGWCDAQEDQIERDEIWNTPAPGEPQ